MNSFLHNFYINQDDLFLSITGSSQDFFQKSLNFKLPVTIAD